MSPTFSTDPCPFLPGSTGRDLYLGKPEAPDIQAGGGPRVREAGSELGLPYFKAWGGPCPLTRNSEGISSLEIQSQALKRERNLWAGIRGEKGKGDSDHVAFPASSSDPLPRLGSDGSGEDSLESHFFRGGAAAGAIPTPQNNQEPMDWARQVPCILTLRSRFHPWLACAYWGGGRRAGHLGGAGPFRVPCAGTAV